MTETTEHARRLERAEAHVRAGKTLSAYDKGAVKAAELTGDREDAKRAAQVLEDNTRNAERRAKKRTPKPKSDDSRDPFSALDDLADVLGGDK